MAKKTTRAASQPAGDKPAGVTLARTAESKLEDFAEDLGRLLGHAQNKAESWLGQREAIADHLIGVRDTATRLLSQLGITAAPAPARRERPAPPAVRATGARKGSRKKKRTMSAEARAKIAAAQRARWAKQKAAEKR